MKFKILSFLLIISASALANELCEDSSGLNGGAGGGSVEKIVKFVEDKNCPKIDDLKNLCSAVYAKMKDQHKKNEFLYQTMLFESACVNKEKDSPEIISKKIKMAWEKAEKQLVCNSTQFDVKNGNLLKYAVSNKFDQFIDEVIEWKVPLNKVDESDGRTVLDYVKFHIERNKGKALEEQFQYYYDQLREAGAKHQSEL